MQRPALAFDYDCAPIGQSWILHADCLDWLSRISENCVHAVVTDPPYGVKEYDVDQLEKRANGNGGIWRIPPLVRRSHPRATAEIHGPGCCRTRKNAAVFSGLGSAGRSLAQAGRARLHGHECFHRSASLRCPKLMAAWSSAVKSFAWCAHFEEATARRTSRRSSQMCRRFPRAATNHGGCFENHSRHG